MNLPLLSNNPHTVSTNDDHMAAMRAGTSFTGHRASNSGFSLVEVMVVLVIIALLAGLVGVNVRGYMVRAKRDAAKAEIGTICEALEAFYTVYDRYPTNEEGLEALAQPTDRLPEPLLDQLPFDPWDRPYAYNQPGRDSHYEVLSLGADGREGGEPGSPDEDLGSWHVKPGATGGRY